MRKHRTSSKSGRGGWRNANRRVPESATEYCRTLTGFIDNEEQYFAAQYLKSEYLSKYLDEQVCPALDRRNAAIAKWKAMELHNAVTNDVIANRDPGYNVLPRVSWKQFLLFARNIISNVLGPLRDDVVLGSYSGGASTSRRRTESHPAQKFDAEADTTSAAEEFVDIVYRLSPLLRQFGTFDYLRVVDGAQLFTVPKKTDIDRCACKEPDFNMFLQKGVGAHIRRRLRRFGINLNDQSINRGLAARGALDGSLATLDLSSASDTVSIECVRALLPSEWFEYLNSIRSHNVVIDGEIHRTEMFSSMGNGFTFELESLLFYAICRTTLYFEGIPGIVSVYGDDIIIPSQGYGMVTWALRDFGFVVNLDKSFHSGPFRESCGGHYHASEDVTPFYLKREVKRLTDVIRVANQLRRWALADPLREYMLPSTYKVWTQLAAYVPRDLWGGCDLGSDTQLVAPVRPINRLVRLTTDKELPGKGAYLHWHNSTWKRTSCPDDPRLDPCDTDKTVCRKRPVRKGAQYDKIPMFRQEWDPAYCPE